MNFEIGGLVQMKPNSFYKEQEATMELGLGLVTEVGATICTIDWIVEPWTARPENVSQLVSSKIIQRVKNK